MNIFNSSSTSLNKDVDSTMSAFKSTIAKLELTVERAEASKAEKQEEIKRLETEVTALDGVRTKASGLAGKLKALFE